MSTPSQVPSNPDNSEALGPPLPDISQLLPMPHVELTAAEKNEMDLHQKGRLILGPVAAAVMTCPEAEDICENLSYFDSYSKKGCPHKKSCPLLKMEKAPHGSPCPIETNYITERFMAWSQEFEKHPTELTETERIAVSDLVSCDLQEQRCLDILGEVENARLTDVSIKESAENGTPFSFEKVIHLNQQALVAIRNSRNYILKTFELTPEMKTKRAKLTGSGGGPDLSTQQSARSEKFKKAMVIEAD